MLPPSGALAVFASKIMNDFCSGLEILVTPCFQRSEA
jgi:hypothetical protein